MRLVESVDCVGEIQKVKFYSETRWSKQRRRRKCSYREIKTKFRMRERERVSDYGGVE
jgi:hypothetical protein